MHVTNWRGYSMRRTVGLGLIFEELQQLNVE